MEILINKRYLKLPISKYAQRKALLFYEKGNLIFDLEARIDLISPDNYYFYDMKNWMGLTLDITTNPNISFEPVLTDDNGFDGCYTEKFRPATHFSAKRGWINDPNGAVYYEGKYHLFFQHNPVGADWGNMHWGHAVSRDLIHWEEKPVALFPDEMGMRHSGSAIVDYKNVTGLKENQHDPLLLFYTASGGHTLLAKDQPFTQCIAYSTDGGETFRRYGGNPVIPHIEGGNRDPKLAYVEEGDYYLLIIFMKDDRYQIFRSENLLDWTFSQEISLPGDNECPDLYPIVAENGKKYWILGGGRDTYLVGQINDGIFEPVQEEQRIKHMGKSYAAQTFFGAPDGRVVRIAWNKSGIPDSPFCGSMATPTEMHLKEVDGLLKLCTAPVKEIEGIVQDVKAFDFTVSSGTRYYIPLEGASQDITLTLEFSENAVTKLNIWGLGTELNTETGLLTVGKESQPIDCKGNRLNIRYITDVHSIEIYLNGYTSCVTIGHLADRNISHFEIRPTAGEVKGTATVKPLKNIWIGK